MVKRARVKKREPEKPQEEEAPAEENGEEEESGKGGGCAGRPNPMLRMNLRTVGAGWTP